MIPQSSSLWPNYYFTYTIPAPHTMSRWQVSNKKGKVYFSKYVHYTDVWLANFFFFFTTAGFNVGTPGGVTNIQPLSMCTEECGLQQTQQYWYTLSTAEDCFFWPDTQGFLHNPTGTKAMGLSSVIKEGRQVALLCWTICKALCN